MFLYIDKSIRRELCRVSSKRINRSFCTQTNIFLFFFIIINIISIISTIIINIFIFVINISYLSNNNSKNNPAYPEVWCRKSITSGHVCWCCSVGVVRVYIGEQGRHTGRYTGTQVLRGQTVKMPEKSFLTFQFLFENVAWFKKVHFCNCLILVCRVNRGFLQIVKFLEGEGAELLVKLTIYIDIKNRNGICPSNLIFTTWWCKPLIF